MAKFNRGILGGFSGKVGTVVGANWRGINVMRSLPAKKNRAATEAQQLQRNKFGMAARFMAPLKPITDKYYGQNQGYKSRTNMAMSHQVLETIVENDQHELEFDYAKIVLAKGVLPVITITTVALAEGKLTLEWSAGVTTGLAKATDKVMVVIYSKKLQMFVLQTDNTFKRADKKAVISVPVEFVAEDNEVWVITADEHDAYNSDSSYLGAY